MTYNEIVNRIVGIVSGYLCVSRGIQMFILFYIVRFLKSNSNICYREGEFVANYSPH